MFDKVACLQPASLPKKELQLRNQFLSSFPKFQEKITPLSEVSSKSIIYFLSYLLINLYLKLIFAKLTQSSANTNFCDTLFKDLKLLVFWYLIRFHSKFPQQKSRGQKQHKRILKYWLRLDKILCAISQNILYIMYYTSGHSALSSTIITTSIVQTFYNHYFQLCTC